MASRRRRARHAFCGHPVLKVHMPQCRRAVGTNRRGSGCCKIGLRLGWQGQVKHSNSKCRPDDLLLFPPSQQHKCWPLKVHCLTQKDMAIRGLRRAQPISDTAPSHTEQAQSLNPLAVCNNTGMSARLARQEQKWRCQTSLPGLITSRNDVLSCCHQWSIKAGRPVPP